MTPDDSLEALRFPTGRFHRPTFPLDPAQRAAHIRTLEQVPAKFASALAGLSDAQLDTPYREGGWTIRQLAHHVPDSHMNAYVRFKLGLTESAPRIKPYDEAAWAKLPDSTMAIEPSLALLEGLHRRWVALLRGMSDADFSRQIDHPEHGLLPLDFFLALYAWHGPHHTAHVTRARERLGF